MDKRYHIKKKSEFDYIFAQKKYIRTQGFTILYTKAQSNHFRYALSIGKKFGKAHARNLIKRQLRAIITIVHANILLYDFIIVIKPEAKVLPFNQVKEQIIHALTKVRILMSMAGGLVNEKSK